MNHGLLDSPCIFCGYCASNYYQAGTHNYGCPWRDIGGVAEREQQLRKVVKKAYEANEQLWQERNTAWGRIKEIEAERDKLSGQVDDAVGELVKGNTRMKEERERLKELAIKLIDSLNRCQLYGPADACREAARQLEAALNPTALTAAIHVEKGDKE